MKVIEYVKEHPVMVGGILVGGIVLYMLYSSAGGGTTNVYSSGPSDAQVQANTALQLGQMNLASHSQDVQANLAAAQISANAALGIKALDVQLGTYQTQRGADVSLSGIEAQRQVQIAGISSQQQIAAYAQQTQQRQIDAGVAISAMNAATYDSIARYNADTVKASYAANTAVAMSNNDAMVAVQQSRDAASVNMNLQQQKTARQGSSNSLIGSIAGGILGIAGAFL